MPWYFCCLPQNMGHKWHQKCPKLWLKRCPFCASLERFPGPAGKGLSLPHRREKRAMISAATVEQVRRLLGEGGLSQRQIARHCGISRGTVNAIALGRRPSERRPNERPWQSFTPPQGIHKRCPGCGAKAQMPCLACYLRQARLAWPNRSLSARQAVLGTNAIGNRNQSCLPVGHCG